MTEAGFALHPDKMSEVSTIIETIGFLVNTIDLVLSFPPNRIQKRIAFLNDCILNPPKSLGDLRQISGKLTHLATVIIGARFFVKPWWNWIAEESKLFLHSKKKKNSTSTSLKVPSSIKLKLHDKFSESTKESLQWFISILNSGTDIGIPLVEKPDGFLDIFDTSTFDNDFCPAWQISPNSLGFKDVIEITTDASSSGGGFWWSSNSGDSGESEFLWHISIAYQSSNLRELLTAVTAIKDLTSHRNTSIFPKITDHALVWLRSDNTATIACINKFTSSSSSLLAATKQLASSLFCKRICAAAVHIPGKDNIRADILSRRNISLYDNLKISKNLMKLAKSYLSSKTDNISFLFFGPSSSSS